MKLRSNPFAAISLALLSATSLHATTLYWDGNDTTANADGGAGTWDTIATNWDTAATAGTSVAWPSTSTGDDDASFGTPGGAVTIASPGITANSVTFTAASYVVGGSPLTLDSIDPDGAGPLLPPAPVITAGPGSNTQSATINADIISPNGLSKTGGSTLSLGGDLSGIVGTLTIDGAITSPINNAAGITLQSGVSTSGLTGIDIKNNSFLALAGVSLGAGAPIIVNGGGGNQAPQGAIRGTAGVSTVAGAITINDGAVRIGNTGTSTTFSGAITAAVPTNQLFVRIGSNQGVILTNSGNSWEGPTSIAEGSLYIYPNALPANSNLIVGSSAAADFGTNGTFTRALGTGAGQVSFGRATDGLRAMGFTARGGDLDVNIGGAGADFTFVPVTMIAATTTATFGTGSAVVAVASATGISIGNYVTGTGINLDTRVTAISGTNVTLSRNPTAASAASPGNTLTFTTLAPLDNAKFNTFTLVLNGANADSALTFQNPIDLNGFNRFLQVSANTATMTGGLKNSSATAASARKTGAGTLIHDPGTAHTVTLAGLNTNAGTLELKTGTVTVSGSAGTGVPDGTTGFVVARGGTFRLSGATVNVTGGGFVFPAGNTNGGSSNFILDSGTFDAGTKEALNAYGATGTTTINGGLFVCGPFRVSQSTGVLNLNGGTLRTTNLSTGGGTATVNFNGGTLQAKAANGNFIATGINVAQVQANGAVIDFNGFAITIPKLITEDSGSTGGGLTKKGTGILDLTADNTYTGTNLIQGGVLRVSSTTQLGVSTAPVTVNGGEFGVSGTGIPSITSLARTFTYTTGGFHVGDVTHTLDVDIALTGSAALSKSGPGVLKLTGANDFTGGISMGGGDNGWIEVDAASDLGTGAKIANMNSSTGGAIGGIRLLDNVTVSDVALNLGGRNVNAATQHALLNVSGNNVWTGNINITNAGGTYYLRSDSGRMELSGILSNAQPANLTADTRAFNLEGAGDYLISGTIADGANANRFTGLVMEGTGTATLTGTNTYTGSTSVKSGTLALVGGSQTSPITVESDAILGFTVGSPTTSTSTVTFAANAKVTVSGTPVAGTLMTASSIY